MAAPKLREMETTTAPSTAQADSFGTTAFVATVLTVAGLAAAFAVVAWRKMRATESLYVSSKPPVA